MHNKEYTIGIFCDLQKAFDCVPKWTVILKLKKYEITGILINWFEFYLLLMFKNSNFIHCTVCVVCTL